MGIRATLSGLFSAIRGEDNSRIGDDDPDDMVREGIRRFLRLVGGKPNKAMVESFYASLEGLRARDENEYKRWISAFTNLAERPAPLTREQVMKPFRAAQKLAQQEAEAGHVSSVSPQSGSEPPQRGGPS